MKIEWLAIWVHIVWNGLTIMMCCCVTSWKIGVVTVAITPSRIKVGQGKKSSKMRRRLLGIAGLISVCLLLNVVSTIVSSAKLEEWSRTTELTLVCTIKETWNSRAWDAYGLTEENIVEVCSGEEIIDATESCRGGCYWHPGVTSKHLTCANLMYGSLEDQAAAKALVDKDDWDKVPSWFCDCPCSRFVEIKRPRYIWNSNAIVYKRAWHDPIFIHTAGNSVAMLTLSHVAQSMVVVIIGLSMGFRSVSVSATSTIDIF
jgi:hypothetical protein